MTADLAQPGEILLVRIEHHNDSVGELPRADPLDVGMAGAGVDQDLVRLEFCFPLQARVVKEEETLLLLVKRPPVTGVEHAAILGIAATGVSF